MGPLAIAGLAGSLLPSIHGLIVAGKQKKMAKSAAAQAEGLYGQSMGYANDTLAQTQNMMNARMAGAQGMEQNILNNQAATLGGFQRNASSGAQLLALAGRAQGQTNQAFGGLAQMEAQNKAAQLGNVMAARSTVQGLKENRANMAQQAANALGNAAMQNKANAINGIANTGIMAGMGAFTNKKTEEEDVDLPKIQAGLLDGIVPTLEAPRTSHLQNVTPNALPFNFDIPISEPGHYFTPQYRSLLPQFKFN